MLAIAHALEGTSRAASARLVGLERQALRDAVVRFNAEGPAGLRDHPTPGSCVFQMTFRDSLHSSGMPRSAECP